MLPRTHIILGALFAMLIWIVAPGTPLIYLALIFLSSFLIDFDHYVVGAMRIKKFNLRSVLDYHKNMIKIQEKQKKEGIREKGDFHLFHTLEFHAVVGVIGIFFAPFIYIFMGMIYHSLLDIMSLWHHDFLYRREYFFFNWLKKNS